jgi:hypothetical protein
MIRTATTTIVRMYLSSYRNLYGTDRPTQRSRGRWWREAHSAIDAESCGEKSRRFSLTRFGQLLGLREQSFPSNKASTRLRRARPQFRLTDRPVAMSPTRSSSITPASGISKLPSKKILDPRLPDDFMFTICSLHAKHPVPLDTNTLICASAPPTAF